MKVSPFAKKTSPDGGAAQNTGPVNISAERKRSTMQSNIDGPHGFLKFILHHPVITVIVLLAAVSSAKMLQISFPHAVLSFLAEILLCLLGIASIIILKEVSTSLDSNPLSLSRKVVVIGILIFAFSFLAGLAPESGAKISSILTFGHLVLLFFALALLLLLVNLFNLFQELYFLRSHRLPSENRRFKMLVFIFIFSFIFLV